MAESQDQDDLALSGSRKNRLPTFSEVLSRRTRPPVDLFMFYLFLQREGAEDILDFWLDVQQHENLCRAYFKDVRKSGRSIKEDWPQYWEYARRRGSIYGTVVGLHPNSANTGTQTKRSTASEGELVGLGEKEGERERDHLAEAGEKLEGTSPPQAAFDVRLQSTSPQAYDPARSSSTPFSLPGLPHPKRTSRAPTIIPRSHAVTRADLVSSADRIFHKYLSPTGHTLLAASHEIYLPPSLRLTTFPLSPSDPHPQNAEAQAALAQIPDMFHQQKQYAFGVMEQDAFPRFLRAKAFGNLTPVSALVRLVAGLVLLWVGLAVGFALIFLDVRPKSKRFFLFIPYTLSLLLLISHQYELDPLLILFNQSESTPFRTLSIREPYVRKLLVGRAIWVAVLVVAASVALTMIFWAVPGHRL